MNKTPETIDTIVARLITDKPVRKTPYQVKGVVMRDYPEESVVPFINGSYRDHYLYPRIQVKVLNEQIHFFGIKEGVEPIKSLVEQIKVMNFGNITFDVEGFDVETSEDHFSPSTRMIRYKYLTPWVALNEANLARYKFLYGEERITFLTRLLSQNIVFLAKEMGLELTNKIYSNLTLHSLYPKMVDEGKLGAFQGEFQTNFILPNYMGIGNGITKGYGVVFSYFNPSDFSFNTAELEKEFKDKSSEEEIELNVPLTDGVAPDDIPKSRRNLNKQKLKRKADKPVPKKIPKDVSNKNEPNYNTIEYHSRKD